MVCHQAALAWVSSPAFTLGGNLPPLAVIRSRLLESTQNEDVPILQRGGP
jgi:hypothetical protein